MLLKDNRVIKKYQKFEKYCNFDFFNLTLK